MTHAPPTRGPRVERQALNSHYPRNILRDYPRIYGALMMCDSPVLWWCWFTGVRIYYFVCLYIILLKWIGSLIIKKNLFSRCILSVVLFVVKWNDSRCRQLVYVIGIHLIKVWLRLGNFSHGSTVKKFASVFYLVQNHLLYCTLTQNTVRDARKINTLKWNLKKCFTNLLHAHSGWSVSFNCKRLQECLLVCIKMERQAT